MYRLVRSIFERTRSTGAFGDISTDHRLLRARWIWRIEQTDGFDGAVQIRRDDVGLDDGQEVGLVDLDDAVEPAPTRSTTPPRVGTAPPV